MFEFGNQMSRNHLIDRSLLRSPGNNETWHEERTIILLWDSSPWSGIGYKQNNNNNKHACIPLTPNMYNFPCTTTEAAPLRGGGLMESGDNITRDHLKHWRSLCNLGVERSDGRTFKGPAPILSGSAWLTSMADRFPRNASKPQPVLFHAASNVASLTWPRWQGKRSDDNCFFWRRAGRDRYENSVTTRDKTKSARILVPWYGVLKNRDCKITVIYTGMCQCAIWTTTD